MKPKMRLTHVSNIVELSPHLRRIVVTGDSLGDFPIGKEGAHVKVVLQQSTQKDPILRSYTIRSFSAETKELALDFVVNRHSGPATDWAKNAKVGDSLGIAGPGPMKLTQYQHDSYLLVGDITSLNAINGYVPRFNKSAEVNVVISVPTRADIIEMDYRDSVHTEWFVEDEATGTLEQAVFERAKNMPLDTQVFLGLEARSIRTLRPVLQQDIGFNRLNVSAVGYWKQGVNADRFGAQKKAQPL
ncbi:siderophore-interacting protein [Agarivorans sp. Toyoura001]|uniref:siderophore-interacting protein n=1 Tax=unclassified Agarivorans TaxID=2636026 RepID=UPI0010F958F2|nr:siderophore-interacting protein [Agarivorans sp. Toyoura001]